MTCTLEQKSNVLNKINYITTVKLISIRKRSPYIYSCYEKRVDNDDYNYLRCRQVKLSRYQYELLSNSYLSATFKKHQNKRRSLKCFRTKANDIYT